jgi:hypothetical protein
MRLPYKRVSGCANHPGRNVPREVYIMGLTNFPNGITSGGVPVHGGGFPYSSGGNHYYTDSVNGSDSNTGTSWEKAKASIFGTAGGEQLLKANQHDVLHVIGGASSYAEAAICTWDKNYTHMVAETNPIMSGGRARLTNSVTTATTGEWIISATGCHFAGLHFQWGGSATNTSLIGVGITGDRNSFVGCNFEGPIEATMGAAASQRMVQLRSVQDNWFYNCKFGQRTILSTSATGAVVEIAGTNNTDNGFVDCLFTLYNSNTASAGLSFTLNAMPDSGVTTLKHCGFQNHHAAATTDIIRTATAAHGLVDMHYCTLSGIGTTIWSTTADENTFTSGPAANGAGGIGVKTG